MSEPPQPHLPPPTHEEVSGCIHPAAEQQEPKCQTVLATGVKSSGGTLHQHATLSVPPSKRMKSFLEKCKAKRLEKLKADKNTTKQSADGSLENPTLQESEQAAVTAEVKTLEHASETFKQPESSLENPSQEMKQAATTVATRAREQASEIVKQPESSAENRALQELEQAAIAAETKALEDASTPKELDEPKDKVQVMPVDKNCKVGTHNLPADWTVLAHVSPEQQRTCKPKAKAKGKAAAKNKAKPSEPAESKPKTRKAKKILDEKSVPVEEVAAHKPTKTNRKRKEKEEGLEVETAIPKKVAKKRDDDQNKPQASKKKRGQAEMETEPTDGINVSELAQRLKQRVAHNIAEAQQKTTRAAKNKRKDTQQVEVEEVEKPLKRAKKASPKTAKGGGKKGNGDDDDDDNQEKKNGDDKKKKRVDPEVLALRSRKSAAYHRARKAAMERGMNEADAKKEGSKVTKLQYEIKQIMLYI